MAALADEIAIIVWRVFMARLACRMRAMRPIARRTRIPRTGWPPLATLSTNRYGSVRSSPGVAAEHLLEPVLERAVVDDEVFGVELHDLEARSNALRAPILR